MGLTGVPWMPLTKALEATLAIQCVAIACCYTRPTWLMLSQDPHARTGHFLLALWLTWASLSLRFVPMLYSYGVEGHEPEPLPGLSDGLRLAFLVGLLTAGAYFMAASGQGLTRLWTRFWLWSAAMAAVAVTILAASL